MTTEQNKLADDGTFTSYADLPDGVRKHLLDLEVFIGEVDGKETVITLSDETCVDNGTLDSSDAVVAFNGIVAALHAAGEPVAYRHKHFPNAPWQYRENETFGTPYPYYEPLYPAQPAPSASVREALPAIPDDDADFTSDLARKIIEKYQLFIAALSSTPSPLMAAGEAETSAQVMVDRYLLRRMLGYARNASCPFSGQPEVENWHSRIDADCRYVDAILGVPALESARTPPQRSRIDAAARASETVEATSPAAPLRLCSYCKTWNSKPCGEQCHWSPADPTVPPQGAPAKRDYAARVMGDKPITRNDFVRLGILGFKEPELREIVETFCKLPGIAPAAAEPTREEIALTILKHIYVRDCPMPQVNALEVADAILALKPRGGQTREETIEECAKIADGWLASCGDTEIDHTSAREYACSAVEDIAEIIRDLKSKPRGEPAREGGK